MRQLISPCGNSRRSAEVLSLQEHVLKNDIEGAKRCITNDVMAWNTRDINGMTPLMIAATLNRTEILQILVNSKCDVNDTDDDGNTALHLAVDEGNTEAVKKLVQSGRCIMDATNDSGETALMRAAFYDYSESARVILKDGLANPDVKNTTGQTALLIALEEGSHVTSDLLLKHGCDVMIADDLGRSSLFMAIHSPCIKSLEIAKTLVATGYDISVDRIWLLNEEKHNLFYQDDEFYADLRRKLRSNSLDGNNNRKDNHDTKMSSTENPLISLTNGSPKCLYSTSPPFAMSPTVKEKIMSTDTPKFTPIPFSKIPSSESIDLKPPSSSPLQAKRSLYRATAMYPSWSKPLPPLSISPESKDTFIQSSIARQPNTSPSHKTDERNINGQRLGFSSPSMRNKFVKSASEGSSSAPVSPIIKYKRQISVQPTRSGSHSSLYQGRKTSLPSKPVVQFSTEIQVFEIKRH